MCYADQIGGLLRKLRLYTMQIPESTLDALMKAGRVEVVNEHTFDKLFYSLIGLDLYDEVAGLSWEDMFFDCGRIGILKEKIFNDLFCIFR